jgi:transcriptional regulator with XRE-family HTH domain
MPPGKADWQKAKDQFPSTQMDEAAWIKVFDRNPDIMWHLIGDIYDFAKAEEERDAGKVKVGRRPRRDASLQEVYAVIFPELYSMDPFPDALTKLISGRLSQGQLAAKVPCDQSFISRLLAGTRTPDMVTMERIAIACRVKPAYFMEWRARYVSGLIERALVAMPQMGVRALRELKYEQRQVANDGA